jgi:ribonuclease P protein subunit POP4
MITPYNVLRHELVGLPAGVYSSPHKDYEKIRGIISGETRNTLSIRQSGLEKKIPKDVAEFEITIDKNTKVRVDGKLIVSRPEDRIKKKIRITFV